MTFWHTQKSEGDNIELEHITTMTPLEKKKFGNGGIPTLAQKSKWSKLTVPMKTTESWQERSKQSHARILAKHGVSKDVYHLCDDYNCPDKGKKVEESHEH